MFTATNVLTPEFIGQPLDKLWSLISPLYMVDESQWLEQLLPLATPTEDEKSAITTQTTHLIEAIRADKKSIVGIQLRYSRRYLADVSCRSINAHPRCRDSRFFD